MTVYSATAVSGAFSHPDGGTFLFTAPNVGRGTITISMNQRRTEHNIGVDGETMVSYVAGDNATVTIEVQQTSALHNYFLGLFNLLKTQADNGDPSNWASGSMTIRSSSMTHKMDGVSFDKPPDISYGGQGAMFTWTLMVASCISQ